MDFHVGQWIFAATLCFLVDARLPAQTAPPIPVFRIPVRLVGVPTLVFSGEGRLVHGLEAANFHLFDEGQEQSLCVDTGRAPFSAAIAVQASRAIHGYMPFIARTGSTFEALFLGLTGEAAVLSYGDEVKIVKPFEKGAIQPAIASLRATDHQARMFDAGMQAVELLKSRPPQRARILVLIGQPIDVGSSAEFEALKLAAQAAAVTIFAVTLPQPGKPFVADTFTADPLPGVTDRSGMLTLDVGKLISVLNRRNQADKSDPFSMLAASTGGTQVFAAVQRDFEYGVASIGFQLRSAYQLSFHPTAGQSGYHALRVEVDVPGAAVYSRPGYWHPAD